MHPLVWKYQGLPLRSQDTVRLQAWAIDTGVVLVIAGAAEGRESSEGVNLATCVGCQSYGTLLGVITSRDVKL